MENPSLRRGANVHMFAPAEHAVSVAEQAVTAVGHPVTAAVHAVVAVGDCLTAAVHAVIAVGHSLIAAVHALVAAVVHGHTAEDGAQGLHVAEHAELAAVGPEQDSQPT